MTRGNSIIIAALGIFLTSCGGASAERSPIGGEARYQTVRELVSGADQPQPREQLLEIARFIRAWERDPFLPTTPPNPEQEPSTPALMLMWLTQTQDVHVTLCGGPDAIAEQQAGEGAATGFLVGSGFGMAAYMIENPEEARDPDSANVQGAGIESGLLWFEAYRRRGQAQGAPILDELIALRNAGGRAALQRYHAEHIRCGRHEAEPLP